MFDFQAGKAEGASLFRKGYYVQACSRYERCLKHCPKDVATLSNLAMVNIKLERWAAAWRHATAVLKEQPKHTKCLYRAGIANVQLERYTDAVACFQAASEQDPEEAAIRTWLAQATERLQQSQGQYDMKRLLFNNEDGHWSSIASYTSPKITIEFIPGKGRGVVLTAPVEAGELLAVCRPLAVASKSIGELEHPCMGCLTRDTSEDLVDKVLDMARKDFWLLQRLYALSDGSQEARQRTPLVGLFQAALSNAQLSDPLKPGKITKERVQDIMQHNSFETGGRGEGHGQLIGDSLFMGDRPPTTQMFRQRALYGLASMFNHSCWPNCNILLIPDIAFIRAAQDLDEGDELLVSFSGSLAMPHKERQLALGDLVQCDCERCELETDGSLPLSTHHHLQVVQATMSMPGGIMEAFRAAHKLKCKAEYAAVAKRLKGCLAAYEPELAMAGLPKQEQLWMQFCVMDAYCCLQLCYDKAGKIKRFHQVSQAILRMHENTAPGSDTHVLDVVRAIRPLERYCPGSKAYNDAISAAREAISLRYGLSDHDDDSMRCAILRVDQRICRLAEGQFWLEQNRDLPGFCMYGDPGPSYASQSTQSQQTGSRPVFTRQASRSKLRMAGMYMLSDCLSVSMSSSPCVCTKDCAASASWLIASAYMTSTDT